MGTLTGHWQWRSCGTWLLGTGRSHCQSGRGRTRGAGHGGRCLAVPAPRPGWPGGPVCLGLGGHSPGQSCEGRGDKAGTGRVAPRPQPMGSGAQPKGCRQVCQALCATISPACPGSLAPVVTPATTQPGPTDSFTPMLRMGTTQCTWIPSALCQHSGGQDWGHQLAKAGCPMSPRWDRTPRPEVPGSRDARKCWLLHALSPSPIPMVPSCPKSSKAPKCPLALARGTMSHGGGAVSQPHGARGH